MLAPVFKRMYVLLCLPYQQYPALQPLPCWPPCYDHHSTLPVPILSQLAYHHYHVYTSSPLHSGRNIHCCSWQFAPLLLRMPKSTKHTDKLNLNSDTHKIYIQSSTCILQLRHTVQVLLCKCNGSNRCCYCSIFTARQNNYITAFQHSKYTTEKMSPGNQSWARR